MLQPAPPRVLFPAAAHATPAAWRAGGSMGQDRTPMTPPPVPPADRADVLDDPRLTEMGLLMEVATSLTRLFGDQIAEHDLVPSEFEVLMRLARSPGGQLRMNDLARQIGLSSSGLTRLADRLEGRGLIERRPCPEDGRGSLRPRVRRRARAPAGRPPRPPRPHRPLVHRRPHPRPARRGRRRAATPCARSCTPMPRSAPTSRRSRRRADPPRGRRGRPVRPGPPRRGSR